MRLEQRLKQVERKRAPADEPIFVFFRTFFDAADGSEVERFRRAVVIYGPNDTDFFDADDDEPASAFEERVKLAVNETLESRRAPQ
ncbi:hypothetical protein [Histidinibacterium aquaticum]|uniref:Uncharacterized protein n=1 Tax=Histidinibacterium aquaticum TaxID=2613962 RepID=A0A5J5GPA8_9RHOB|nr:hypothetical protein [Histidinibacterium aquaticum]KAA9010169.1 hypothetical protein F3S47_02650 [Histidinibacterium aquaticum]